MSDATFHWRRFLRWAGVLTSVGLVAAAVAFWKWKSPPPGPSDHWAEVARARAYLNRGRPDLAFQVVSHVRDDAPGAAESLTIAAQVFLMYGEKTTARRALERSLTLKPEQPDAAKMLAAFYLASGDGPRGVALLKQAAGLDPADFRPWYALGKVYHDLGELSQAAEAFAQSLKRSPPAAEDQESRIGRIRALLDNNSPEQAAEDLAVARARWPDDPTVLGLAARQARALGQGAEARDLADRAVAADPRNFDGLLVKARLSFASGHPELALPDLEEAVRVNPNDLGALQLLSQVQSRLGLKGQAADTQERFRRSRDRVALMDRLTREINQRPDDPEPRWRMGQAAVDGNLETLARQCFQAALDIDPHYRPARDALSALRSDEPVDPGPARPAPPGS